MGIKPSNLFGSFEQNNSYGKSYELKRQLNARQSQLDALNNKKELSSDDEKRRVMLTNAVNQLSTRIDKDSIPKANTISRESTEKAADKATAIHSKNIPSIYSSTDGKVIQKSPSQDYLKGFFVDLKI